MTDTDGGTSARKDSDRAVSIVPKVWIREIGFSSGVAVKLTGNETVLVVGPNNSGKSETLRGVHAHLQHNAKKGPVVESISLHKEGSAEDVRAWIGSFAMSVGNERQDGNYNLQNLGASVHVSHIAGNWQMADALQELAGFFCRILAADDRLSTTSPAPSINFLSEPSTHPIQALARNGDLEAEVSAEFRRAFGQDLLVHRFAGRMIPLYMGIRPVLEAGKESWGRAHIEAIERLSPVDRQGDGVRSFLGVLLHILAGREPILLIDEPEAFLHPPQARLLGRLLATRVHGQPAPTETPGRRTTRQLLVATHSGDVLRGALDQKDSPVRVIRIQRDGTGSRVKELQAAHLTELWADPLLRHSNILDGVFHERVVVCEADGDARFLAAMVEALTEGVEDQRRPDLMFTHVGGKDRLPVVVRAMKALDVPVVAIADLDLLADENLLRRLVESSGGDWSSIERDWKIVNSSIEAKRGELTVAEVRKETKALLENLKEGPLPDDVAKKIRAVLKRGSPWAIVKETGTSFIPSGAATQACERLLAGLKATGVLVVECGELEGFDRAVSGHGPTWVNAVLKKDLRNDPTLERARAFTRQLVE